MNIDRQILETDTFFLKRGMWNDEILAFCRKLERERDEAREETEYYKARYEQLKKRPENPKWYNNREIPAEIKERDEAREVARAALGSKT